MAETKKRELVFHNDPINEQVVIAAVLVGGSAMTPVLMRHQPDAFISPQHVKLWGAMQESQRRKLSLDPVTLGKISGGEVDPEYVLSLIDARPDIPENFDYHLRALLFDKAKQTALVGPVTSLLEALQNPKETPDRIQSLATQIQSTFRGYDERQYLLTTDNLVSDHMREIRARMSTRSIRPYGIRGLDYFESGLGGGRRLIPGAVPGQITVVTGVSGAGKSTFTANLVLGLARQRLKVLWGAWEMSSGLNLEMLTVISLAGESDFWSRTVLQDPIEEDGTPKITEEQLLIFEKRKRQIGKYVRFLANPFRRQPGKKRGSNEANLDLLQGYISDSGCDVFVGDLWKRCLVDTQPDDEEQALIRQQSMLEELGVHGILLQQQRLKDVEQRADKRPTREGIKGSGAWTEVGDTIFGVHRPALWKPISDEVMEIDILKQRYGKWPLAIEFGWDASKGLITGGQSVDYEIAGGSKIDFVEETMPRRKGRRP